MSDMIIHSEADDRALVDVVIASLSKPKSFVSYKTKFSADSSGDDSTWIMVQVNDGIAMSNSKTFKAIQKFVNDLNQRLLSEGVSRWPYVVLVPSGQSEKPKAITKWANKKRISFSGASRKPTKKLAKKTAKKATRKVARKAT